MSTNSSNEISGPDVLCRRFIEQAIRMAEKGTPKQGKYAARIIALRAKEADTQELLEVSLCMASARVRSSSSLRRSSRTCRSRRKTAFSPNYRS